MLHKFWDCYYVFMNKLVYSHYKQALFFASFKISLVLTITQLKWFVPFDQTSTTNFPNVILQPDIKVILKYGK